MDSLNISSRVLSPILEELGSAKALSVAIKARYGDYAGILSMSTDPRHYDNAESYYRDTQAIGLYKKLENFNVPGIDRSAAAYSKWCAGEFSCYRSNERLAKFNYGSHLEGPDLALFRFFRKVRKEIREWIGSSPPNLDTIRGKFGPGATYSDRGRLSTVADKITSVPTLTSGHALVGRRLVKPGDRPASQGAYSST